MFMNNTRSLVITYACIPDQPVLAYFLLIGIVYTQDNLMYRKKHVHCSTLCAANVFDRYLVFAQMTASRL